METKKVVCGKCGAELKPCPARWDGELTFVGWYHCSKHPNAAVRFDKLGVINNTMPQFIENLCAELQKE